MMKLALHATAFLCAFSIVPNAGTMADITDGMVCHLTFDGDVQDQSGGAPGNHARAVGDPVYEAGRVGRAIVLRGSVGQYVDLGQSEELQFGNRESGSDFSVSMWVRIDTSEKWPVLVTNKDYSSKLSGNSSSHTGWGLFVHTDRKLRWNCKDDKNAALYIEHVGPVLADGTWRHVTVTHDRQGKAVTYVDGRSVASMYMGALNGTVDAGLPTVIGNDGIYGMGAWDGAVDEVGIWRRVLTPSEVWSVYSAGVEGTDLGKVQPVPALFDSDGACRWIPDEPEPRLSVTVTNNSLACITTSGWRIAGPNADAFRLTSAVQKTLSPNESMEVTLTWDRLKAVETDSDAALLFDHNGANRESAYSVDLSRQVKRAPYRYRLDGFQERVGLPVPRDEQGRIVVNDGYHDDGMVEQLLKAFADEYPIITKLERIGVTWEQRPLWALKISADAGAESDKPSFLFVGAHHGSELLSTEFVLDIIHQLTTSYDATPKVRQWLERYEIWCIPLANPDGCC